MNTIVRLKKSYSKYCLSVLLLGAATIQQVLALDAPTLQNPANNQQSIVQHPDFLWSSVQDASTYNIQISSDSSFSTVLVDDTSEILRYVPLSPLTPQTLYWRVRAKDASGTYGAWSTAFTYLLTSPTNTYTVPAGATLTDIQNALNQAKANAPAVVSFASGATYNVTPDDGLAALVIHSANDIIVEGNGCTFIINNPSAGFVDVSGSKRITVRNFYIDYNPQPCFVGMVESLDNGTLSLRRATGYPDLTASFIAANFGDGSILDKNHRGWLKSNVANIYNMNKDSIASTTDPDLFTIQLTTASDSTAFAVGDPVVIWARPSTPLCWGQPNNDDITYSGITSYASPNLHYMNNYSGSVKVLNCHAVKKDETRWVAGNADGVHTQANRIGPWIESSSFEGIGDDGVAIYNRGMFIQSKLSDTSVRIFSDNFYLAEGDSFTFFNPRQGVLIGSTFTVQTITTGSGTYDITFTPSLNGATLTGNLSDQTQDDQIFNMTKRNSSFAIKNNVFDGVRRYGSIVRSTGGVIKGTTYQGVSTTPITFQNEAATYANGLYSENTLVTGNTIQDSGFDSSSKNTGNIMMKITTAPSAATATGTDSRLHQSVVISGNTIKNWNKKAMYIQNSVNTTIEGNIITSDTNAFIDESYNYGIYIDNTANTVVADNDMSGDHRAIHSGIVVTSNNTAPSVSGNTMPPTQIVDSADSTGVVVTGSWTTSSGSPGYYGNGYMYCSGGTGYKVQFTPAIATSGTYDVYARWTADANRAPNVPVDIVYASGTGTATLNQQVNGGEWVLVGSYLFATGTTSSVTIRNDGASGIVVADAIMFVEQ